MQLLARLIPELHCVPKEVLHAMLPAVIGEQTPGVVMALPTGQLGGIEELSGSGQPLAAIAALGATTEEINGSITIEANPTLLTISRLVNPPK